MLALLLAFFFSLLPSAALAEPLTLEWRAPSDCPDRDAVQKLVSLRLGEHPAAQTTPLEASGDVVATPGGYALTLRTLTGERHLEAPSCDELAQSAAIILALLIDPHAAPPREPPTAPEPEPATPAPLAPPPPPTAPTEPAPSSPTVTTPSERAFLGGFVRAELIGDLGLLPHVALGPAVAAGVTLYRTTFELSGSYLSTQDLTRGDGRDVADLRVWAGRLGACQALSVKPELGPCLFLEHARLIGRGNLNPAKDVDGGLWSLLLAARLGVPFGRFAYVLELGLDLPLTIAEYKVQGTVVYETSVVVGRLRTGFELRF